MAGLAAVMILIAALSDVADESRRPPRLTIGLAAAKGAGA
jgi:hypothetical protein